MTLLIPFTIIISIIVIFIPLLTFLLAGFSLAPWVPARHRDLKRIFKIADLKPGELFYDLGCGHGQIVIQANKHFQAKAVGLEISLPLFLVCKIRRLSQPGIRFKYKNIFREDLSPADVIYVYGLPDTLNNRLRQKLEKELKPGARIISYGFAVKDWRPAAIDRPTSKSKPIYLYKFGK